MEYGNISNSSIYGTYTGSYDYQTKQYQTHNQNTVKEDSHKNNQNSLTISEEAKKAMSESKTQMIEIPDCSTGLTSSQIEELKNHFEQEEGTRTDMFSRYLNQMTVDFRKETRHGH